ncbi:hypothetical protein MIR68_005854 [Amoeboaphelidium protococcarum]|nr:hypothetical protein MIR68_005854 [Amoeboaphelidium protococcarum]
MKLNLQWPFNNDLEYSREFQQVLSAFDYLYATASQRISSQNAKRLYIEQRIEKCLVQINRLKIESQQRAILQTYSMPRYPYKDDLDQQQISKDIENFGDYQPQFNNAQDSSHGQQYCTEVKSIGDDLGKLKIELDRQLLDNSLVQFDQDASLLGSFIKGFRDNISQSHSDQQRPDSAEYIRDTQSVIQEPSSNGLDQQLFDLLEQLEFKHVDSSEQDNELLQYSIENLMAKSFIGNLDIAGGGGDSLQLQYEQMERMYGLPRLDLANVVPILGTLPSKIPDMVQSQPIDEMQVIGSDIPPPPPPPPPSGASPSFKLPPAAQTTALPIPMKQQNSQPTDTRSSLMESIRNAGGSKGLKPLPSRIKGPKSRGKSKKQSSPPTQVSHVTVKARTRSRRLLSTESQDASDSIQQSSEYQAGADSRRKSSAVAATSSGNDLMSSLALALEQRRKKMSEKELLDLNLSADDSTANNQNPEDEWQ